MKEEKAENLSPVCLPIWACRSTVHIRMLHFILAPRGVKYCTTRSFICAYYISDANEPPVTFSTGK